MPAVFAVCTCDSDNKLFLYESLTGGLISVLLLSTISKSMQSLVISAWSDIAVLSSFDHSVNWLALLLSLQLDWCSSKSPINS